MSPLLLSPLLPSTRLTPRTSLRTPRPSSQWIVLASVPSALTTIMTQIQVSSPSSSRQRRAASFPSWAAISLRDLSHQLKTQNTELFVLLQEAQHLPLLGWIRKTQSLAALTTYRSLSFFRWRWRRLVWGRWWVTTRRVVLSHWERIRRRGRRSPFELAGDQARINHSVSSSYLQHRQRGRRDQEESTQFQLQV